MEVGYTGYRSYHQLRQRETNPGMLIAEQVVVVVVIGVSNITVQWLNPNWGSCVLLETTAKGEYHVGYVKFDRRMSKGLLMGVNYIWSFNFSDNDEAFNSADISSSSLQIPQDYFNLRN